MTEIGREGFVSYACAKLWLAGLKAQKKTGLKINSLKRGILSKNSKGQLGMCRILTLQIKMMRKKRKKLKKIKNILYKNMKLLYN
jgi:hypothetical protein